MKKPKKIESEKGIEKSNTSDITKLFFESQTKVSQIYSDLWRHNSTPVIESKDSQELKLISSDC